MQNKQHIQLTTDILMLLVAITIFHLRKRAEVETGNEVVAACLGKVDGIGGCGACVLLKMLI